MRSIQTKQLTTALFAIVIVCTFRTGLADGMKCEGAHYLRAEQAVSSLSSWISVFDAYRNYRECDDGAIAEGFTDAVSRRLATEWQSLSALHRLSVQDRGFRRFVLRHVNESADPDDLRAIARNAETCPPTYKQFCSELRRRALLALERL